MNNVVPNLEWSNTFTGCGTVHEVVNLLKECVECYMTIVIYCVMMVQKLKSLISILWLKGHRNVNGSSWLRNSDHAKSMIRLTM